MKFVLKKCPLIKNWNIEFYVCTMFQCYCFFITSLFSSCWQSINFHSLKSSWTLWVVNKRNANFLPPNPSFITHLTFSLSNRWNSETMQQSDINQPFVCSFRAHQQSANGERSKERMTGAFRRHKQSVPRSATRLFQFATFISTLTIRVDRKSGVFMCSSRNTHLAALSFSPL